jgi:hypothetical protein
LKAQCAISASTLKMRSPSPRALRYNDLTNSPTSEIGEFYAMNLPQHI